MDQKKAIICIACGNRFFVTRDEYEERKTEPLCDMCFEKIKNDQNDDVNVMSKLGNELGRVAKKIASATCQLIDSKKNSSSEDENNE